MQFSCIFEARALWEQAKSGLIVSPNTLRPRLGQNPWLPMLVSVRDPFYGRVFGPCAERLPISLLTKWDWLEVLQGNKRTQRTNTPRNRPEWVYLTSHPSVMTWSKWDYSRKTRANARGLVKQWLRTPLVQVVTLVAVKGNPRVRHSWGWFQPWPRLSCKFPGQPEDGSCSCSQKLPGWSCQ